MEASQNESDKINQFGDRDFILAAFACFLSNSNYLEVIRHFRSLENGGSPFPIDGSIAIQK
jgi:hypothetical protein